MRANFLRPPYVIQKTSPSQKGERVLDKIGGKRHMRFVRRCYSRLLEECGAAETSTILAWIVVGVLVVFALRAGLQAAGNDVIDWIRDQFDP